MTTTKTADEPRHKTVLVELPDLWETPRAGCRRVDEALDEASEDGRWTLVSAETLVPAGGGDRLLLAVFRRSGRPRDGGA